MIASSLLDQRDANDTRLLLLLLPLLLRIIESQERSRVGGPSNPFLKESGLSTMISKGSSKGTARGLVKAQNKGTVSLTDRALLAAFEEINMMADKIDLSQAIKDRAKELFTLEDQKTIKSKNTDAVVAACLYMACRLEGVPRTIKEICALSKASKKEIGRYYKNILEIWKKKNQEVPIANQDVVKTISTEDFMARFCSRLGLPQEIKNASDQVATKANELYIVPGKSPVTVAAAAIFLVAQLTNDHKRTQKEIADVTGVSEPTIRNCYRDLHARQNDLVPAWFNKWLADQAAKESAAVAAPLVPVVPAAATTTVPNGATSGRVSPAAAGYGAAPAPADGKQ
eukprot:GEZU01012164.1.p1 GENE.GEZU01012164.1~~GEZU01012164.1.p1  ORF type:complete len:342 (+),score=110.97 GEZU01012164.1:500-1525(+)